MLELQARRKLIKLLEWGYEYETVPFGNDVVFVIGDPEKMSWYTIVDQEAHNGKSKLDKQQILGLHYLSKYFRAVNSRMKEQARKPDPVPYDLWSSDDKDNQYLWDWYGITAGYTKCEVIDLAYKRAQEDYERGC